MPAVKYGSRKVNTAAMPGARLQSAETDTSTGAGFHRAKGAAYEQLGELGNVVRQHATFISGKLAEEEKQRADEVALLEAERQMGQWTNARLYDPKDGALGVKGKDAMPLPENVLEEFDKVTGTIADGLSTERQRQAFARSRANAALNLDGTLRRHVYGEMQAYEQKELAGFVDTSTSAAIANANDPRRVGLELQGITDAIERHAPRAGMGPDQVKSAVLGAQTKVHTGVIDRLLADGKDKAAKVYFEETKGQIDGEVQAKIEKALDEGTLRGESQRAADKIIATGGTLSEQRAEARNIDDPKTRDAVMERIEHEATVRDRQEREAAEAKSTQAFNLVDKTHDVRSIPSGMWSTFTGSEKSALRNYAEHLAGGIPVTTDQPTFYKLMTNAGTDPTAFVKENLLGYKDKLSSSDFQQLAGLQLSIRNGDRNKVEKDLAGFRTKDEIVKNTLTQYGIDPSAKPGTPAGNAIAQLQRMLDVRIESAQAAGSKVTNVEIQGELDKILAVSHTTPGSWWSFLPGGAPFYDQTKRLIESTVGDIPAADRKLLEDALRQKGKPVSDATVLDLWLDHQVRTSGK